MTAPKLTVRADWSSAAIERQDNGTIQIHIPIGHNADLTERLRETLARTVLETLRGAAPGLVNCWIDDNGALHQVAVVVLLTRLESVLRDWDPAAVPSQLQDALDHGAAVFLEVVQSESRAAADWLQRAGGAGDPAQRVYNA